MYITSDLCDDDCPVRRAMEILDGKWTLLVIRELLGGRKRFNEMRYSITGISPKVLAERLKVLERGGILTKTVYAEVPPRTEYELTDRGQRLRPVVEALRDWGSQLVERMEAGPRE